MDNRRAPGSSDPSRYVSEVGTDTVPVSLVEIQSVVGRKRRPMPVFLVSLAAVAIVAFALGASFAASPSPSPTAAALSSPIATASARLATASPRPRYTMQLPTAVPITPTPTNPFAWTWNRTEFLPGEPFVVTGMWGAGQRIVALGWRPGESDRSVWTSAILEPEDPESWQLRPVPQAISELHGVSVIDDRLWALAQVEGVGADPTWQLVSTQDGLQWSSSGPIRSMRHPELATFIARTKSAWVVGTNGDTGIGGADGHLWRSTDGIAWREAALPPLPGPADVVGAATLGDKVLVLGRSIVQFPDVTWFVLLSSDGATWRRSDFTLSEDDGPTSLACLEELCLTIANPYADAPGPPEVLTSYDGLHWTSAALDLGIGGEGDAISHLIRTDVGFIGSVAGTGQVIRSFDGKDWDLIPVMPPDRAEYLNELATGGNTVVGYVEGDSDVPSGVWTGVLAALPPSR